LITSVLKAEHFNKLGFYSLLIIYASVVFFKPIAPAIVKMLGEKWAMIIGSLCYCTLLGALIHVEPIAIYITSGVLGFGGSILWVGNGAFLTLNSTPSTRGKNAGLFWGIFQLSGIIGNLGAFFVLYYTSLNVTVLMWAFTVLGALSAFIMLISFRKPDTVDSLIDEDLPINNSGGGGGGGGELVQQSAMRLLLKFLSQKNTWLLIPFNFFIGYEMSYNVGTFTQLLDVKLIGLVMALYSLLEVAGGVIWGRLADKFDRRAVLGFGLFLYLIGLSLSFLYKLNIAKLAVIHAYLPYVVAVGLGLGDSCSNVHYYSAAATAFDDSLTATAFAVFQQAQALGSATGFLIAVYLPMETCKNNCDWVATGSFLPISIAALGFVSWVLFNFVDLDVVVSDRRDLIGKSNRKNEHSFDSY
jgi:MFS family permease